MLDIRTVLCPVDLGGLSERNLGAAVAMAERFGARLIVHHNLGPGTAGSGSVDWLSPQDHEREVDARVAEVWQRLDELLSHVPASLEKEAKLTRGPVEQAILELATVLAVDVLVISTGGRSDLSHSSLTERLISRTPCTVLVLGESCSTAGVFEAERMGRLTLLAPADLEAGTREVLVLLEALAETVTSEIHLLHVLPSAPADLDTAAFEARNRLMALVPETLRGRVHVDIRFGQPAEEILLAACEHGAVIILMAAHRKGGLSRLVFGDNAFEVLHESPCPVWFVPVNWRSAALLGKEA